MKFDALPIQVWIGIIASVVIFVSVLSRSHRDQHDQRANSFYAQHQLAAR